MAYSSGFRAVTYYVNWAIYGRNYPPQDLPADKLTHVLYAFADIDPETGEVKLTDSYADSEKHYEGDSWQDTGNNVYGSMKQLFLLKKQNRNLKILLSIGGWNYSPHFAKPASTSSGRVNFANTAVALLKDNGLDGLDLDWEYPENSNQARDYVLLLKQIRFALDAYSKTVPGNPHFELTIAAPCGPENLRLMDLKAMDQYLDFWNLMAYDFTGTWSTEAGHQANIGRSQSNPLSTPVSVDDAVRWYTGECGISPSKLVIGMPLYGRSFAHTKGPGTPYQGVDSGASNEPGSGVYDFKDLPRPGAQVYHDSQIGASWTYDPNTEVMITYEDKASSANKVSYIQSKQLGGAMWWEASGDRSGDGSLINMVVQGLGGYRGKHMERKANTLSYPYSQYENMKQGFPGEGEDEYEYDC